MSFSYKNYHELLEYVELEQQGNCGGLQNHIALACQEGF